MWEGVEGKVVMGRVYVGGCAGEVVMGRVYVGGCTGGR